MLRQTLTAVQRAAAVYGSAARERLPRALEMGSAVLASGLLVSASSAGPILADSAADPTVEFTTAASSGAEGGANLQLTLQLSFAAASDVTVPIAITGDALQGTDYTLDSVPPVVIPAGQVSFVLTLDPTDDALDENDESAIFTLGTPTGATLGTTVVHTATVIDDDATPDVQFVTTSATASEGAGLMTVDVQLSAASGLAVSVPLTTSGTATLDGDYSLSANPLVVPAGQTSATLTLTLIDDPTDEDDETAIVTLGAPTNAILGASTVYTATVTDDDSPPSVQFVNAGQAAGEAVGTVPVTVTLSLASGKPVSVPFAATGTALDPDDYSLSATPIVIPVGALTADISVTVVNDLLNEADETVALSLGTPTNASLGAQVAHTLTLTDDDSPPTVEFQLTASSVAESGGSTVLTVDLSAVSGQDVTVPFTVSGDALDPEDYGIDVSPLVIPAGQASAVVNLTVVDDTLYEADETVVVTLDPPTGAGLGANTQHTVTLSDNDTPPTVDFDLASQASAEAAVSATVTVNLSEASGLDVSVPFTAAGTAVDPDDYGVDVSPLVIPAGSLSADIIISIVDDSLFEADETVELTLGTPTDGSLGVTTVHTHTLQDDEAPPLVDFLIASQAAGENAGTVTATVSLSSPSGLDVTVPFSVAGTAQNPEDYSIDAGPLVIPAGQTSADILVYPADDVLYEPAETVEITLGTPVDGDLGSTTLHTLTLNSDDPPPTIQFTQASQSAGEGAGSVSIGLTLSGISGTDVSVPILTSGSATDGVDYTLDVDPVIISAGQLTGSTSVTALPDALYEQDESAVLTLGTPSGADLGTTTVHTLTLVDDDPPPTVSFQTQFEGVDEDAGAVLVTLELSAVSGLDVTVPFTHQGTADVGTDYNISGSPVVISAGTTSTDIVVTIIDDADDEFIERIRVLLDQAGLVNATPGAILGHRINVRDNDGVGWELGVYGLRPDVTQLQFPQLTVGSSDGPYTVTVTNTQQATITFDGVQLEGDHPEDYQVTYGQALPLALPPGQSATFDVAWTAGDKGPRDAVAHVLQTPHGVPEGMVDLSALAMGGFADEVRMNVGPDEYLDVQMQFWSKDFGWTGDSAYIATAADLPGSDDDLYNVARVGTSFGYSFVLPDGDYDVVLHFAELEVSSPGQRVMDVMIEGLPTVTGLDLVSTAGTLVPWNTGPLRVTSSGGTLDIDLLGTTGEALLSAIEVRSVPVINADVTALDFGVVDQGSVAQLVVQLTNNGLANATATQLAIVLDGNSQGTGNDFYVRIGNTDYYGGVSTVLYNISLELNAGMTTPISVFFAPTTHADNVLRIEFGGDFDQVSIDLNGLGGANPGWGYLHPVPQCGPDLIVDYDGDGSEDVALTGSTSHTHEPGQTLAAYEWAENGVPFSTQADTNRVLSIGSTSIELTVTDDKAIPDTAMDSLALTVHQPDSVPGILTTYYDGAGDPVFLLDNIPGVAGYVERISTSLLTAQDGKVGGSPFTGDAMVRWEARFVAGSTSLYDFVAVGGVDSRIEVDGQPWGGAALVAAGIHDIEVRFAVNTLADMPLQLDVLIDGQLNSGWGSGLVYDATPVLPIINEMPTVGTELGGNPIKISGFGFFPKDQVTVNWGATNLTLVDFTSWADGTIEFLSPPGTGTVQVTVSTPNGVSDPKTFLYSPDGPVPIKFDLLPAQELNLISPTTATWHPNGRLYVGSRAGFVYEIEFDENWTATTVTQHPGVSGLTNYDTLGIAVNPYDPPSPVKLYVTHGELFLNGGGAFQGESPFTGQVSILTGPNFDTPQPLITQLPTSNHDHGVCGLVFDNNGDLLIAAGGNTNAGVKWPLLGDLPGSPFSGAILRAATSRPDFNGAIQYVTKSNGTPTTDQVLGRNIESDGSAHIEVFASGLRNSYDLALTTWGLLYCTDNGPNTGYGPASTGANTNSGVHPQHDDELCLVRQGNYYGHANRNRGDDDSRQHIWRTETEPSDATFTQRILAINSATGGLAEYRAQAFNGLLRGQLVAQVWNSNQTLIELSPDRQSVQGTLTLNPLAMGLDVITGPGGALLTLDYTSNKLRFLVPDDVSAVGVTVHDVHPWRSTATGGTPFVIGGENFVPGQTSVTIGGVSATLTAVTARRIQGVFPPLPVGNIGALSDIVVTVAADQVGLPAAVLVLPANPGEMLGFWTTGASMPDALGEVACAVVDTTMYVFGEGTDKTYAYDLIFGTWSDTLALRPFPGSHHGAEVIGGKVYLFGGFGGGSAGRVQIYDALANSWTTGTDMPWAGGSCNTGVVGGLIYVCGGIVGNSTVGNLSLYDPLLDDWDQGGTLNLANMPTPVNHAAAMSDGTKLWVFGGRQGGNTPQAGFDTVQSYDPVTGIWDSSDLVQSSLTPMPLARGGTGRAVWFGSEFYVFGGESVGTVFPEVQVYRPASNTWRAEADMLTARHGTSPVAFQDRIFVVGGGVNSGFSTSDVLEIFQRP
jgi:glucose/arabinose dehydrogenase/N-acetylneuraminic acid mutarotase